MVFLFSACIRKFSSYFQFHVILIYNDFTAKLYAKYFTKIPLLVKIISNKFTILSMFFFFLSLNSRNSITIVPIDMKLDVWTGFGDSYIVSGAQIVMLTLSIPITAILALACVGLIYHHGFRQRGYRYTCCLAYVYV